MAREFKDVVQVRVTDDQRAALLRYAAEDQRTPSTWVRMCMDAEFDRRRRREAAAARRRERRVQAQTA